MNCPKCRKGVMGFHFWEKGVNPILKNKYKGRDFGVYYCSSCGRCFLPKGDYLFNVSLFNHKEIMKIVNAKNSEEALKKFLYFRKKLEEKKQSGKQHTTTLSTTQ